MSLRLVVSMSKRNRLEIDVELVDNFPKKMKFENVIVHQAKKLLELFLSYNTSLNKCVADSPYFPSFALPPSMPTLNPPLSLIAQQVLSNLQLMGYSNDGGVEIIEEKETFVNVKSCEDEEEVCVRTLGWH